ncbi:MAG: Coenzyme F420 hydrogenase/dehydrogenase, beta subunit C-terminal domain [Candidatus Hydrothermarchaeales archaeon]
MVLLDDLKSEGIGFHRLKKSVIDSGYCTSCGACVAFCNKLAMKETPQLIGECILDKGPEARCGDEGLCYDNCPMVLIQHSEYIHGETGDPQLGSYKQIKKARTKKTTIQENAQDGGAVTTLLLAALENKLIDGALVVDKDEKWNTVPKLITTKEELQKTAGSKYTVCPNVLYMGKVLKNLQLRDIAIVGTPCQIHAVRNLQETLFDQRSEDAEVKIYTIGLFCSGTFHYDKLIAHAPGTDITKVKRMDFKKNNLQIKAEETVIIPIDELEETMMESCHLCIDYTAELADIAVGSVGTPKGWSTVIVRSELGEELLKNATKTGYLETEDEVNTEHLKKVVSKKKEKAMTKVLGKITKKQPVPPVYRKE